MKKYILNTIVLLAIIQVQAQSIERQVIGVGGLTLSKDAITLDFTIGETIVTTISQGNSILTQGFHQIPFAEVITVIEPDTSTFSLYPNPTSGLVYVEGKDIQEIELYAITGQRVYATSQSNFDITHLSSGVYIVRIRTTKKLITHRIVKE